MAEMCQPEHGTLRRVLVTGGGGFLGRAIVDRLQARGGAVRSFSRGDYPDLRRMGVEVVRGDLCDADAVAAACAGADVVFHVAARPGIWGRRWDYHRANVLGTEHVIAGCRRAGVPRLVFTSSPSVVFDGRDMAGVDESVPYPRHYEADYPRTKALAEQAVIAANDAGLGTVALRPHLLWGPGDNHLVPRILVRARALRRIGRADPLVDSTYIDNAADAHVRAAERLAPGSAIAGRVYFISNGEPRRLWELVNGILAAAGLPPVEQRIPRPLAMAAAAGLEAAWRLLRIESEPRLTRFLVRELSTAHWFDLSAARRDLGYEPAVSIDEGLGRLEAWLQGSLR
jgi:nucleoside-diphosphate-sugar epimerase